MLEACGSTLLLSIVKPVVPPNSFVAVAAGVAVAEVIRLLMFHIVTKFEPVVPVFTPVPTNSLSLVPSKNSVSGEQVLAGFAAVLMFLLLDIAGVAFITPFVPNRMAYNAGLVAAPVWVPQA